MVAFMDMDGSGTLDFAAPEPLGWYAAEAAAWIDPIDLPEGAEGRADVTLRRPTPFPRDGRVADHGALRWMKGLPVLQLTGTARQRGFAHGFLVGEQIVDFFEFYVLEDSWQSATRYEAEFVPFLQSHFDYDPEYLAEVDAVVEGMKASGMDMRVEWLGRDFGRVDLLAINAYIERRAAQASPAAASSLNGPACTQFAFWGEATQGSELAGGLIAGRNMDGEVDLRKVTVSHLLLFAVDPSEPGRRRWVSAMWPGFVGTITGLNEEGLYAMENAGGSGPGPVVDGLTPCSWVQRNILENAGAESTPASIGDRFGTDIPEPGEVAPASPFGIMAANHFMTYGVDPDRPGFFFGKEAGFSSTWRYEAGMNTLEAWLRQKKPLGTEEMRRLLQSVAHGTTEHSVIFRANDMTLDVAVDDLETDLWDAPYQPWVTFTFEELFGAGRVR
ncbi:MAG TPA: hypothetical protein VLH75_11385 [Longimicrobiales bacterium]|nr:hypothetical protein [Longimicrobiales bacterium]